MRSLWAAAILALSVLAIGPAAAGDDVFEKYVPADPPRPVPGLALADGQGRALTLEDFRGRTLLLNLWATWCAPCRKEMPALDRLQAEMGGPDFEIVALSLDFKGLDVVEPFFREHGITHLTPYLDPKGAAMRALNPEGLPVSILIDPEGREVGRVVGDVDWDAEPARALIRDAIGSPAG